MKKPEKRKKGKTGSPDSDYRLIIVLGTALLLAILLICAIMLTTPTVIS
jgi:hypothetical protein